MTVTVPPVLARSVALVSDMLPPALLCLSASANIAVRVFYTPRNHHTNEIAGGGWRTRPPIVAMWKPGIGLRMTRCGDGVATRSLRRRRAEPSCVGQQRIVGHRF